MSKSKKIKNKITAEDLRKMTNAAHRQALIDAGLYNIHKNKTFKDKSKYNRNDNRRIDLDE